MEDGSGYDYEGLYKITKLVARNLNKIIDVNFYPVKEAENSNKRHRPIGIGCQGLADAFILLRLPFESDGASELNKGIFETMYFAALETSCELAIEQGPYKTYEGSPMSKGVLQFDMWNVKPSDRWDWDGLRAKIATHGVRNSLLLAPMPTASTSQILGNNEACEAFTSNFYVRRVLAGEFTVINHHLVKDLQSLGLWTPAIKTQLVAGNGSVQHIADIPSDIKALYKTVWEISQKKLLDMSADRGAYIDQSQSMNVHMSSPNIGKLSSMHFHGWKVGLKTGMYYLRTRAAVDATKVTVAPSDVKAANTAQAKGNGSYEHSAPKQELNGEAAAALSCSIDNPEDCLSCGA
eukprot:Plantae.Rhodophyta-Palmaria_palmata.ctg4859.p1 GENE.Plantae.Rhodophyta-Palmaria_palmata.ctg4859~~Plantae.Rhodophyta-Palmaria_palmata.ctg4859.p1  ORF type:complete len:404 (+),score=87.26 Plantae.Rhodophyta-Palmaria_palmata.ctg4859:165-1214(+)